MKKNSGTVKEEAAVKYIKYGFWGLIAIIVIAVILIVYFSLTGNYVAIVGNEKVTVAEFNFFFNQEKADILNWAGVSKDTPQEDTFWSTTIEGEDAIDVVKKGVLENIKDLKVQVIKAQERDIRLEKSDLDGIEDKLNQIKNQYNGTSGANDFLREDYGVNLNEIRGIYKQIVLVQKLRVIETESMVVSEADIDTYYQQNTNEFMNTGARQNGEEAVWARHILISTKDKETNEDLPEDKIEEARKKAEGILDRIKAGEDFIALAKELSEDPGSVQYGGDYVFSRNVMMPEFENTAFNQLNPGQMSDVIKTDAGYHIIKLEEKVPEGEPVSLSCAMQYREFGLNEDYVKAEWYQQKVDDWKKDSAYDVNKNDSVYNSIK